METNQNRSRAVVGRIFLFMVITVATIQSCNKPSDPDSTNWWFRKDLVPCGIKSINEGFYTYHFDKDGRNIHTESSVDEWFYEYNSDGLLTKETYINPGNGDTVIEQKIYEYNNKGKFVQPLLEDIEGFAYFNYSYLIPDLSRVIMTTIRNGELTHSGEKVYEFHADSMLIIHFGHYNPNRDTTVVMYKGDYPYQCTRNKFYFGPITYQENGMFSEFRRVFKNYDGSINRDATFYYRNINGQMLIDKRVYKDKYQIPETTYYTYDDNGNPIREIAFNPNDKTIIAEYSYVFDSKGNWVKKTSIFTDTDGNRLGEPRTETRTIEYW